MAMMVPVVMPLVQRLPVLMRAILRLVRVVVVMPAAPIMRMYVRGLVLAPWLRHANYLHTLALFHDLLSFYSWA